MDGRRCTSRCAGGLVVELSPTLRPTRSMTIPRRKHGSCVGIAIHLPLETKDDILAICSMRLQTRKGCSIGASAAN